MMAKSSPRVGADLFGYSPPLAPEGEYPHSPGFRRGSATSREAAARLEPNVSRSRMRILIALVSAGKPLTADELAAVIGKPAIGQRPRCSELLRLGLIRPAESRGRNHSGFFAQKWEATDQGRDLVEVPHD